MYLQSFREIVYVLRPPVFEKCCDTIYPQQSKTHIAVIEGKIKKPLKIRKSDP